MIPLLVVLLVYLALLIWIARMSMRPPKIPIYLSPAGMGAPQEEVAIPSTDDVVISGWWVDARGASSVVVLAHGYVMNRCELTPVAAKLWKSGVSCLLIDFRAHGLTRTGKCSFGWNERHDVAAAVAYARERIPGAKVVLIGSSMGSAAGALAWAENPDLLDGLVMDSCYSKLPNASLGWWRFLGGPILSALLSPTVLLGGVMLGINLMNIDIARELKKLRGKPILILHGDQDDLALPSEAKRNLEALGGSGQIVWFEGSGHSEGRWLQPELYDSTLRAYLIACGVLS